MAQSVIFGLSEKHIAIIFSGDAFKSDCVFFLPVPLQLTFVCSANHSEATSSIFTSPASFLRN